MRKRERAQYQEGDWFALPVQTGGFAVGRIARVSRLVPGTLLGYFFAPRLNAIPSPEQVQRLSPKESIRIMQFGHLGLVTGRWQRICSSELNRTAWPVPGFIRRDLLSGKAYTVTYSDDPAEEISIRASTTEEIVHLPEDGIFGHVAVEIVLTKLLSG